MKTMTRSVGQSFAAQRITILRELVEFNYTDGASPSAGSLNFYQWLLWLQHLRRRTDEVRGTLRQITSQVSAEFFLTKMLLQKGTCLLLELQGCVCMRGQHEEARRLLVAIDIRIGAVESEHCGSAGSVQRRSRSAGGR